MGWISRKNEKGSYVARYRDPSGREHSRSFRTRTEAKAFLNSVEDAKQRGDWTNPAGAKVKFKDYADQYVAGLTHFGRARSRRSRDISTIRSSRYSAGCPSAPSGRPTSAPGSPS
jgi:hypothetical protein